MPEELIKKLDKKISNDNSNKTSAKTIENKSIDKKNTTSEPLESDKTYQPIKNENTLDSEHKTNIGNKISLNNFEELLTFLIENREALLHAQLVNNVVIDSFESGKISMKISENCTFDVIKHLSNFLKDKTGLSPLPKLSSHFDISRIKIPQGKFIKIICKDSSLNEIFIFFNLVFNFK